MKRRKVSGYVRGRGRELGFVYKLWGLGYYAQRSFRSAGGQPGAEVKPVDVIASKQSEISCTKCGNKIQIPKLLFIQISKYYRDISKEEKVELLRLAKIAGAKPLLAVKEGNKWKFLTLK